MFQIKFPIPNTTSGVENLLKTLLAGEKPVPNIITRPHKAIN